MDSVLEYGSMLRASPGGDTAYQMTNLSSDILINEATMGDCAASNSVRVVLHGMQSTEKRMFYMMQSTEERMFYMTT